MSTSSTVPHRLVHQLFQLTKTNVSRILLEITGFIILVLNLVVAEMGQAKKRLIDPKIESFRQKMISLKKIPNRLFGLLKKYFAIFLQFVYKMFGTVVENVWIVYGKFVKAKEWSIDPIIKKTQFCREKMISLEKMLHRLHGALEEYYSDFILNLFRNCPKFSTKTQ